MMDQEGNRGVTGQHRHEPRVKWLPFPGQTLRLPDHRAWKCRIVVHRLECAVEDECKRPRARKEHLECGIRIVEDPAQKIIFLLFSKPPTPKLRSLLTLRGFFHAGEAAWARTLTRRATSAADSILRQLAKA